MSRSKPVEWRGGFTLVEMLAVLVVLAIAASILGVSLARADDAAAVEHAESQLCSADAQARLLARSSGGAVVLRIGSDGAGLERRVLAKPEVDSQIIALRPRVTVVLRADGQFSAQPAQDLYIDRLGRSGDAEFDILLEARLKRRLRVFGLTGQFIRVEAKGSREP